MTVTKKHEKNGRAQVGERKELAWASHSVLFESKHSRRLSGGSEFIEFVSHLAVTVACCSFEAWPVDNGHCPSLVLNQSGFHERTHGDRNACALVAEHHCKELMRHRKFV